MLDADGNDIDDEDHYLDPETINGLNLYAYCGNNPVMNVDPNRNDVGSGGFCGVSLIEGEFRVAPNRTMAFAREAIYLNELGGALSMNQSSPLLNKINSPGLKYLFMWL